MPFRAFRGSTALVSPREIVAKVSNDALMSEIELAARKLEPELAEALLAMLSALQDVVPLDELAAAVKAGDIDRIMRLIGDANLSLAAGKVTGALQDAAWAGGAIAATSINSTIREASFVFNRLNPRLIDWLQGYTYNLVKLTKDEAGEATKQAIREAMTAGMTVGNNPLTVARDIRASIGLTPRQQKAVKNFRTELESFHLRGGEGGYNLGAKISRVYGTQVYALGEDGGPADGITERRLRDFRYDGHLSRALKTGVPLKPEKIDEMVAAYHRKYLKYRSQTIARTEALRATNYGVQDGWRQAIEAGKVPEAQVRRQWVVSRDERLCEVCAPVPKLNPKRGVKFGEPFATPKGPVMLPPLHPNCRCHIFIRVWEPEQLA